MKIECPHCNTEFQVTTKAVIPKEQELYLHLKCDSEFFCAKTIGKTILNMEALQSAVAKELGVSLTVFIKSIELKPHEIKIGFLMVNTESTE